MSKPFELDREIKKAVAAYSANPSQAAADAIFHLSSQRAAMMKRRKPKPPRGWFGPWFNIKPKGN